MSNPYKLLRDLIPTAPLLVGVVTGVSNGTAVIELPGGSRVQARGVGTIGQHVFMRDGAIEGDAPSLPIELIEI
jgi:hypothetical protein